MQLQSYKHEHTMMKNKLQNGFTLIELLIVMAILGILAGLLLTNLQGMRSRARDARRKADLDGISKAVRLYSNNANRFPASNSTYRIVGCGTSYTSPTQCSWGGPFSVTIGGNTTTFMGRLPTDPLSTSTSTITYYYHSTTPTQFLIVSDLEIGSDQDAADSILRCQSLYNAFVSSFGGSPPSFNNPFVLCAQ